MNKEDIKKVIGEMTLNVKSYVIALMVAYEKLEDENKQRQQRIDKAINLVNNEIYHNRCDCKYCNDYYLKQMIEILGGKNE